ncbi:MAG: bacillolysin [Saprospiraceae bacterium]|jgi:bacillolysin
MKFITAIFSITILFFSSAIFAQNGNTTLSNLKENYKAEISINTTTQNAEFIRFPKNAPLSLNGMSLEQKANSFFNDFGEAVGLNLDRVELKIQKTSTDRYGNNHLYFQQTINNLAVFGGDLRLHFDANEKLTAVNGVFIPNLYVNPTPIISTAEAAELALNIVTVQTRNYSTIPSFVHTNELKYFRKGLVYNQSGENHLVYHLEVRNDANVREYLFIDAHTGKLVEQFTGMPHAMHRRVYENNTSNEVWNEGDAFPGSLTSWQQNEVVTSEDVYNFFNNAFGFTSYDGADAEMLTINNNPNITCPNASWNGLTANYCDGTASDDIIGHEWGHAYTEYTSNLIYAWQSGALNESYSDIWGETIDLLNGYEDVGEDLSLRNACNSSVRWRMGEDATSFGGAIRDMYDPTCNGDPGKVSDSNYRCATGDSGGVHSNSGVNNHLYMLLVDGGVYNGQTVTGIGFTKAAHIFWRSQSIYLTNVSDFIDQADGLEAACQDLLGIDLEGLSMDAAAAGPSGEIITAADCQEVADAIAAVEMRLLPDCNFQPLLAQSPPDLCTASDVEDNIFYEDFESGIGAFTTIDIPTNSDDWEVRVWVINNSLPISRAGSAMFGIDPVNGNCGDDLENGIILLESPQIMIPAGRTANIYMTFEHYVATEAGWDGGNLKYSVNNGTWTVMPSANFTYNTYNGSIVPATSGNDNPMESEVAFTGSDGGSVEGTWGKSQLDLTSLVSVGDNIQFRWELGTDGCNGRDGWYVDNVQVCTCENAILPVELVDFTARAQEKLIVLNWETVNERNNAGFSLERSLFVERDFEEIEWVKGSNNSSQNIDYNYDDREVIAGLLYYYRLRQIDLDGTETISKIVNARIKAENDWDVILYPNPAQGEVRLQAIGEGNEISNVSIIATNGQVILQFENANSILKISDLSMGLYWVKIASSRGILVKKLFVE